MIAEGAPVGCDQQQPRGGQRGKQAQDAEIPDFAGVYARDARGALRQNKGYKNSECSDRAIGWDQNGADVEEDGMHVKTG